METSRIPIITGTRLSQKPQDNSVLIAVTSVLIMLAVSLFCWREGAAFCDQLAAVPEKVLVSGEYWRLLTAMALHVDIEHFFWNAVLFALFSFLLYGYFGFWVYPLLTLALGSLVNYLSLLTYPPGVRLVGSSGLVYLMAGFWLTMYILVERRITLGRRLLHGLGVGLIVLMPSAFQATVSYRTHAFGLAIGIVSAIVYFLFWKPAIRAAEEVEYREEDELL
jgi:rhomboid protease GluP